MMVCVHHPAASRLPPLECLPMRTASLAGCTWLSMQPCACACLAAGGWQRGAGRAEAGGCRVQVSDAGVSSRHGSHAGAAATARRRGADAAPAVSAARSLPARCPALPRYPPCMHRCGDPTHTCTLTAAAHPACPQLPGINWVHDTPVGATEAACGVRMRVGSWKRMVSAPAIPRWAAALGACGGRAPRGQQPQPWHALHCPLPACRLAARRGGAAGSACPPLLSAPLQHPAPLPACCR